MSKQQALVIEEVSLNKISGVAFEFRRETKEPDQDLLQSIKQHGLIEPIVLRPLKPPFEIVCGSKRYKACKKLGLKVVPAILKNLSDKDAFEVALTENIQRSSLDPLEEARAFEEYTNTRGYGGVRELARKLGKSETYILERERLVEAPKEIQKLVKSKRLKTTVAQNILRIKDPKQIVEITEAVKSGELRTHEEVTDAVRMIKDRDVNVETAVQIAGSMRHAKEVAEEMTDTIKEALIEADKEAKKIQDSDVRKMMENYMFLGTVIENMKARRIFCADHPKQAESLEWSCGTDITKTHKALKEKLNFKT